MPRELCDPCGSCQAVCRLEQTPPGGQWTGCRCTPFRVTIRWLGGGHSATEEPTMGVTLGIDIGTSGTKTLAIDQRGAILASALETYPCYFPKPLWSEQDPEDWWQATIRSVRKTMAKARLKPARREGDRAFRPDARLGVPRPQRQGDSPGDPLERSADGRRVRRDRRPRRRPGQPDQAGRQPGHDRLHRAENPLAAEPRAEAFREDCARSCCRRTRSAAG